jgi:hypothetical protein
MSCFRFRSGPFFLTTALLLITSAGAGQNIIVQGRVVERGTAEPINAATVELSGVGRVLTNATGAFVFINAKPGRRNLKISMFGYRTFETRVDISGDTTVAVELEVEAVRVQGVTATNRTYTIKGEVLDQKGEPVMDVDVLLGTQRKTGSNANGRFKLTRVPVGQPQLVQVRGLGLLPYAVQIDASQDTTIRVVLSPDPIGLRMIDQQITRLEVRTRGVGQSLRQVDREALMRLSTVSLYDVVVRLLPPAPGGPGTREVPCLFIDERRSVAGMAELMSYLPDEIERVEIIARGVMVRVYTRRYVQEMIRKRANPGAIVLIETPRGVTCQ